MYRQKIPGLLAETTKIPGIEENSGLDGTNNTAVQHKAAQQGQDLLGHEAVVLLHQARRPISLEARVGLSIFALGQ